MATSEPRLPESLTTGEFQSNEERALLAGLLKKDRKATAEFVARYADAVYAFVRSRLTPQFDAVDDLVQEIFLAAWEGIGYYRGMGSLQGWLIGIARHKVEDYYRARLRAPEPLPENEAEPSPEAANPDLESLLTQEELRSKIWRVLGSLPEQYRLALVWRYWERVPAREMAARTGKTEKAIERLLARAREQFRARWARV